MLKDRHVARERLAIGNYPGEPFDSYLALAIGRIEKAVGWFMARIRSITAIAPMTRYTSLPKIALDVGA
jgi:hypothetical protein